MRRYAAAAALLVLMAAASVLATSYNTPYIDGHVTTQTGDWEADELAWRDPNNDNRWGSSDGDLVDLYVTWDADSLYVGLKTVNGPSGYGNGYLIYIDADAQNGITGVTDFTSAEFYPRRVTLSTMGVEAMLGAWNLDTSQASIQDVRDPAAPIVISESYIQINPGFKHFEAGVSWNGLYGRGQGQVPAGTKLRFICAVVGGNDSGAYDALPTSSTGYESMNSTPYNAYTNLDRYVEVTVDSNGDGVPDDGYPPRVTGFAALDDENDNSTVVTVTAYQNGLAVRSGQTAAGGGAYAINRLTGGTYDITATAPSYMAQTAEDVVVADLGETTGPSFTLQKVTGRVNGEVALSGGPGNVDVTVTVMDPETGETTGEGPVIVEGGSGAFSIGTVLDGTWIVRAEGKGYIEAEALATITEGDTTDVGLLTLPVVVATKYGFSDSLGNPITSAWTTVSLPDEDTYYYARARVEPRDDGDRVAYWDYDAQGDIALSVSSNDPAQTEVGNVIFADADEVPLIDSTIPAGTFEDGRALFLLANDVQKVVRVRASSGGRVGDMLFGIDPAAPVRLRLDTDNATIPAGDGVAHIVGQLVDASGNASKVSGVVANMTATGVGGSFSDPSPMTLSDGRFELDFSGTLAGSTDVSATIDLASPVSNLDVDTLRILIVPSDPAVVEMEPAPLALRQRDVTKISAQVKDAWGNDVALGGLSIALTGEPAALVGSIESPIITDSEGHATGDVESGDAFGILRVTGSAAQVDVEAVELPIDATIRAMDEVAPESDANHNSNPGMDLTALRVYNTTEELVIGLVYYSVWERAHVGVAIETKGDAAGAVSEPFTFPITYGHALLPDYAFTYRVNGDSYADFRRWGTDVNRWQWYNWDTGGWVTVDVDPYEEGIRALGKTVFKYGYNVWFHVPFSAVGVALGDTIRVEAYTMQENPNDYNDKYTALDSVPQDATLDMVPAPTDSSQNVTLSNYATYVLRHGGTAPELSDGRADPSSPSPGDPVKYTVRVTDTGRGVGDVLIDLSSIAGDKYVRMVDDGTGPDDVAGNGIYTARVELSRAATDGEHALTVTAWDGQNDEFSTLDVTVDVNNPVAAIRVFDDPEFDDHGPNGGSQHPGDETEGLYYYYPMNLVFRPGSFDITRVEVLPDGDRIIFRTYIYDLVNHQDPGAADWGAPQPSEQTCSNPNRTDMNLQKIDIFIDAKEGEGATSGFTNRLVDIATVDAWEYGLSVEGWGKWFVISNDSNSSADWTLKKEDADISICDDYVADYIDISVNRELLGLNPDDLDDNAAILSWDIIVCISSHDGDSSDDNLGGIRWVNGSTGEWQFGGGRDGEGGRDRDPNIIDVATSAGLGHASGRTQEEMLDYTTAEAERRFSSNRIACVVEASFAVDTAPPVIYPFAAGSDPYIASWVADDSYAAIRWPALDEAPAVMWTKITDVTGVDVARFHWYPDGQAGLRDSVDMVN
ncbi:MAG: hypothetical protein JXB46_11975, partial [Candidatus Eisenbacteria bacterium]|nr:hypothetical protein [Candidatus Eisenbacteria bacterium]